MARRKAQAQATATAEQTTTATATATAQTNTQTVTATNDEQTHAAYTAMLRTFETAYATGDYGVEVMELATAVARSVLKKCCDPQRKSATERETVSASGMSPALVSVRRGITADVIHLENLHESVNRATAWKFNQDGDIITEVVDSDAEKAVTAMLRECLSDGLDIVHDAVIALLEQASEHATTAPGWIETPYELRRLSRRVIIKEGDSAKWETVTTSPIQEVYRAVRRSVQNSRAMQTDPRNGYLYIEDIASDPDSTATETIYRRLGKWADLGGYEHSGHFDTENPRKYDRGGRYTADAQTAVDYAETVRLLNLTDRQAQIIRLRMAGYGYRAIATYLGIKHQGVVIQMQRIQQKCEKIGFTPAMWAEMTEE